MKTLNIVQQEYKMLDVMKFVMAIVVVAIHTRPELSFKSTFIRELFEALYSIAVPFFFMASGFLLFRKIELPLNKDGEVRIKSYLKRMCKLYLVWTIIYLPLTIYGFYLDGIPVLKAIVVFLRNVLLVGENFMSWPLWYLLALIVAVGIIYALLKVKVPVKWIVIFSVIMAIIGVALDYCKETSLLNPITEIYFSIFLKTRNGFFVGFLFVALGMLCSCLEKISPVIIPIFLMLGILGIIYNIPLSNTFVVLSIFIVAISLRSENVKSRYASNLRMMSSIIYFIHMFIFASLVVFLGVDSNMLQFVIVVMFSILCSLLIIMRRDSRLFKICCN